MSRIPFRVYLLVIGLIFAGAMLAMALTTTAEEAPKPNMQPLSQQLGDFKACEELREGAMQACIYSEPQRIN